MRDRTTRMTPEERRAKHLAKARREMKKRNARKAQLRLHRRLLREQDNERKP